MEVGGEGGKGKKAHQHLCSHSVSAASGGRVLGWGRLQAQSLRRGRPRLDIGKRLGGGSAPTPTVPGECQAHASRVALYQARAPQAGFALFVSQKSYVLVQW